MPHRTRYLDADGRDCTLRRGVRRHVADGWRVIDTTPAAVTFGRELLAPRWWAPVVVAVSVLLVPATVLLGPIPLTGWMPRMERFLRIRYRGPGAVSRRSFGTIPRGWS